MAVDSRDKRMSMVALGSPVPAVLPNPDSTIGTQDRAMLAWLYHGLALSAPTAFVAQIYTVSLYANISPAISLDSQPSPAEELEIG